MKNIRNYKSKKYSTNKYTEVESNIYKIISTTSTSTLTGVEDEEEYKMINELKEWDNKKENEYFYYITYNGKKYYKDKNSMDGDDVIWTDEEPEDVYVTSIMFEQEIEYGEGTNASDISQYPLEDILDKFYVYVSDFYSGLNTNNSEVCYLEFASEKIDDIKNLRSIIGKHVYNKEDSDRTILVIDNE